MECPNCGYRHGWEKSVHENRNDLIEGEFGDFAHYYTIIDGKLLYGCPKCRIVFTDEL